MAQPPEVTSQIQPPRDDAAAQLALTVRQVAVMLGLTPKAVYHRAQRGHIPGKFYVGSSVRFRRADLLRFIAEGRVVDVAAAAHAACDPAPREHIEVFYNQQRRHSVLGYVSPAEFERAARAVESAA